MVLVMLWVVVVMFHEITWNGECRSFAAFLGVIFPCAALVATLIIDSIVSMAFFPLVLHLFSSSTR